MVGMAQEPPGISSIRGTEVLHSEHRHEHRGNIGREGISLDPEALRTGGNSGYQALNVAVLSGASTVLLVGYDGREPLPGQGSHWFGNHPKLEPIGVFATYRESFSRAAAAIKAVGVRVINCSPGSAINAFEKMDLEAALAL
jgi:hypothetical protein